MGFDERIKLAAAEVIRDNMFIVFQGLGRQAIFASDGMLSPEQLHDVRMLQEFCEGVSE